MIHLGSDKWSCVPVTAGITFTYMTFLVGAVRIRPESSIWYAFEEQTTVERGAGDSLPAVLAGHAGSRDDARRDRG